MSENNYSNGETKDNKAEYQDENYQGSQIAPNNTAGGLNQDMYYDGRQIRNFQLENRIPGINPPNYMPRGNDQYSPNNRPGYNNSVNQANYNQNSRNYYRGDDRMNYQNNYSTNYRNGYRMEDDYGYRYPYPKYYDDYDCDCDCDCYESGRPYYGGARPFRGPRAGAWYPNMRYCDPYYNYGMMPNSWWNQRMITDFINRPRVNNFFRGIGIATVGLILAPSVAKTLRPIVVKAVQGAMSTSEEFRNIFADTKEDIEDIFAEAKWEGKNNERHNSGENENQNK